MPMLFYPHLIRISYNHLQARVSFFFLGRFTRLLEAGSRLRVLAVPGETGRVDAKRWEREICIGHLVSLRMDE